MQIQQRVLRLAAAAGVTMFLVAGAVGPVYATDDATDDTTTTRTERAESGKAKGKSRADHSDGNASTTGDSTEPQPESTADENDGGANAGDCDESTEPTDGTESSETEADSTEADSTEADSTEDDSTEGAHSYCSTRDGSPSENGEGDGEANGKPCAGCVGKADNKNPKGQYPDGSDANNGYECDGNNGIGKSNPAHTGCTSDTVSGGEVEACPEGAEVAGAAEGAEMPSEDCVPVCPEAADMDGEVAAADESGCLPPCPEGADMESEDCVTVVETPGSADEVLGSEAEANRAPADVSPIAAILPATGAGRYALPVIAGLALLGAGGVLLLRKRSRADS